MNPLKLMDEINSLTPEQLLDGTGVKLGDQLRAAIEAQAAEVEVKDAELAEAKGRIALLRKLIKDRQLGLGDERDESCGVELGLARARIARLEKFVSALSDGSYGSLRYARMVAEALLNESPTQSTGAIRAGALREAAREYRKILYAGGRFTESTESPARFLEIEADRIEREAGIDPIEREAKEGS